MSNKTIRIRTSPDGTDKTNYLKVKLEQDFDFLEILSLSITQEEVYRRFCSDYGVVVGRAFMNNGVGIPNAKVSIFVPLDAVDAQDEEIRDLYPFESLQDKDSEGRRYNLLPDSTQFDCHTTVGTLPNKREVLDNDKMLDVHCKYYKYTAVTNDAGDFMIFGVPVGTWFMAVDCDLSDIGIYSQRPYDFMREGQPKEVFDSSTKFKGGLDLDKLTQIKSQQTSVNVRPFWGDDDQCEVGITRLDVDLKHDLKPAAIFMGSIFGDNEKNSINKRCRPRKKLGKVCETIANAGSIEMLRKDLSGNNERFDTEGGRVINEEGAWAYQVPMNLDYVVTNEFGDLVPTEDPTKGIPTRARVRLRAGMDISGGEGRLRTRAKYLIPHNPNTYAESDYSFDDNTTDAHFRDMYWNKIYSVKNFIPRFQTVGGGVDIRAMLGLKDVDDCTGTHNPFPFNRLDSDFNPLFSILCVFVVIISTIVSLINAVLITLINVVIAILNFILNVILSVVFGIGKIVCALKHLASPSNREACRIELCESLGGTCVVDTECKNCDNSATIPYIPCITLGCQDEEYGPGCFEGGIPLPWAATDKPPMKHWPGDPHGHVPGTSGWAFCVALSLAQALDVWEFDFYNDWVNGSLYSFLLKYKKKKRGKEKFCEFDCRPNFTGGVDGNDDGNPDNKCQNNWLVDSCTGAGVKSSTKDLIKDGLVKSFDDTLYYAAYTHDGDYKLFATDIIDLGAVFECDWQGTPLIHDQLVATSYKTPALLNEYDSDDNLVVSGYDSSALMNGSLFFEISCAGLATSAQNCINIKRQCEIGVGLDEDREDEEQVLGCTAAVGAGEPDNKIDNCDIDNLFIRDVFTELNLPSAGIDLTDVVDPNDHALFGFSPYDTFRAYGNNPVSQPRGGSYYFYFGLTPGRTALDLMNNKFFEDCIIPIENDFVITGVITDATTFGGTDGAVDITIVGGIGPFTYVWNGPFGFTTTSEDISGVPAGNYTVTVVDSTGAQATTTFAVGQPFPVNCFATPTPTTTATANDGQIQIVGIGGGTGPYNVSIGISTHTGVSGPTDVFTGLPAGFYTVTVVDSLGGSSDCGEVEVTSPPALAISVSSTNASCNSVSDGTLNLSYTTGVAPVTFYTTGPAGYTASTTTQTGLAAGVYNITATDSIGQTIGQSTVISQPSSITALIGKLNITCNGSANGSMSVGGVAGGTGPYTYAWEGDTAGIITTTASSLSGIGSGSKPAGTYTVIITDANGCQREYSTLFEEPTPVVVFGVSSTQTSISITPNGGNGGPYQFRINSGTWQSSGTFTGLSCATLYSLQTRDVNGCQSSPIGVATQAC